MTVYTTLPTDDENLEVIVTDDPDLVTININPAQVTGSGGTTGTVEQVNTGTGLTGGPITTTGTIAIDETSDINFNSVTADFFGVQHFTAKAIENISAGQPVYISGHSGNTPEVGVADWDDDAKMPAFGIASADININNNGAIATYGDLKFVDTTGTSEGETWAVGDTLYVNEKKLTNTRPTTEAQDVQAIAKVIRVHAQTGQMFLTGAGRVNDIPNLSHNHVFIGNTTGYDSRQLDTSDILEDASNLFYTDSRVQTVIDTNTNGYITASSSDTLTNKSGNISQWTNDAGYITSETDNQTLSFSTPDLTISNGNTVDLTSLKYTDADVDLHLNSNIANNNEVLTWRTNDWDWTTLADVATSNDYNDLDNRPTLTTINNNADNRIITGSGTAETLNGEADFTWDGTNAIIDGTASSLTTPVLSLVTDNSSWNTPQLMCTDSNGKVFSQVGQLNTGASSYVWNITLDPDNTHGRTGGVTTFAGDYYVDFRKEYDDQSAIKITQNIFGANGGYIMRVKDDFNSNSPRYDFKPMTVQAEEFRVEARDGVRTTDLVLTVDIDKAKFEVPIGHVQLSSDPSSPEGGWTYYNTTTDKLRLYVAGSTNAWVDLN